MLTQRAGPTLFPTLVWHSFLLKEVTNLLAMKQLNLKTLFKFYFKPFGRVNLIFLESAGTSKKAIVR